MKRTIILLLIILCITFIFTNSLMNADQSKEESSKITIAIEKVVSTLYKDNTPEKVTHFFKTTFNNILRDSAHFIEFLILGIFVTLYSNKFKSTNLRRTLLVLLFCILISLIDETIQFFSPGRAFELYDMALDSLGSIIGILLIFLIYKKRKQKKEIA